MSREFIVLFSWPCGFKMHFTFARPRVLEDAGDDFFAPARPEPLARPPGLLEIVLRSRANLLSCWRSDDYRAGVWSFRLLGRQVVVANTPEAVKTVLGSPGPLFERKSPQMRRALEVLLGDGLFPQSALSSPRSPPLAGGTAGQLPAEAVPRAAQRSPPPSSSTGSCGP
jgi:hypothetical protein